MTDGILLAETRSDPLLSAYEALIIDEAHERSLNIDFLIGYLRTLLSKRPDLKVIITSATIDTELFSRAFDGAPIFEVSGRLFPVEVRYQPLEVDEESDELSYVDGAINAVEVVLHESRSGDVLVFMPTERDIRECCERLSERYRSTLDILPLMGSLSAGEQERVFRLTDKRKIIVATNIAETSLTIPRIRYVVDSGYARISRYNGRHRTKRLPIEKIAKSSAHQRAGRAGRVEAGVCIRLYREEDLAERPDYTDPEILRANLAEVILRMKAFNLGDIEDFPFLNQPDGRSIRSGYSLLHELGALTSDRQITPLGAELARLPVDPTIGRILLQARREHSVPEAIVIAAGLSIPDPRERPADTREKAEAAHREFVHPESDFLTLLTIWNRYASEWQSSKSQSHVRKYCKRNFLSYMRMREWSDLIKELQEAMGVTLGEIAPVDQVKKFDGRYRALHRAVLSGFLGQVAYRIAPNTYRGGGGRELAIFPGSSLIEKRTVRGAPEPKKQRQHGKGGSQDWVVAGEVVETSRVFARLVGKIQVAWIEELGKHLCKRTCEEPRWSPERGEIVAHERVTMHGLVLAYRRINYGRYEPEAAADLFIRNTLVGEASPFEYPFIYENRRTADKVATLLATVGRLNRIELEDRLVQFYRERLPGVSSSLELHAVVHRTLEQDPRALHISTSYLTAGEELPLSSELFPNTIQIAGSTIDLHYRYEPGGDRDGVTLALPLALARNLPARMLDGVIEGLREQQISYLIRSLPKELRKRVESIPSVVATIARHSALKDAPLVEGVCAVLASEFSIDIPSRLLSLESLPNHLRPRIEITSEAGEVVSGRDLAETLGKLSNSSEEGGAHHLAAWTELRDKWERGELSSWDFGDLPDRIEVTKVSNVPMYVYPALKIEESRVALRLVDTLEEARLVSYPGIRALGQRVLAKEVQELKKQSKEVESFKSLLVLFCTTDHMKAQVVQAAVARMFEGESVYPLTHEYFDELLVTAKARIPDLVPSILRWTKECLELRSSLIRIERPYPGMRTDLDELLSPSFVTSTPFEQLRHLPRYVRGMKLRCERAEKDPKRYHERELELLKYVELVRSKGAGAPPELRWLVEEFKISLFAQELGTQYPISARRIERFLEGVRNDSQ
jgi:ATP-dependent helicase HrpA